ncbi:MAG: glycosyltransferase family 4 protein [Clostridiales bacterium]|nr:glycosyltransferase family 4 protein [Clostridiales bacterium]
MKQQAEALNQVGHQVTVLHCVASDDNADTDCIVNGVRVIRLTITKTNRFKEFLFCRLGKDAEQRIRSIIIRQFDVVSFHFGSLSLLSTTIRICKEFNTPIIRHFHGRNVWKDYYVKYPLLSEYNRLLRKNLYRKLNAAVCVSRKVLEDFRQCNTNTPGYIVYNGVDTRLFSGKSPRKRRNDESLRILCVANLIPIKGQKYLIEAASQLAQKDVYTKLTFAGRGPDEELLKTLVGKYAVDASFVGYLPYERIADLMLQNDVFIMPSYYEALGCVYLEAMASGMITVGVKGQGIDEVIEDGKNGYLVEPKNSESLVKIIDAINSLSTDTYNAIISSAINTSNLFSWSVSAKQLSDVYMAVTNNIEK